MHSEVRTPKPCTVFVFTAAWTTFSREGPTYHYPYSLHSRSSMRIRLGLVGACLLLHVFLSRPCLAAGSLSSLEHATGQIEEYILPLVLRSTHISSHAARDSSRACARGTRGSLSSTLTVRVRTPMIEEASFSWYVFWLENRTK